MIRSPSIEPWVLDNIKTIEYDAVITTVGYERRARYIAENLSPQGKNKIAAAFKDNCVLDFNKNLAFFKKANYEIKHLSDEDYYQWAQQFVVGNGQEDKMNIFLIDISSMSRYRIASLVWALASCTGHAQFCVDFLVFCC